MKTALKLVFIYLGIQLVCGALASVLFNSALAPTMWISMAIMFLYLWRAGHVPGAKETWSVVSAPFLLFTFLASVSSILLMDLLSSQLTWLPDLLEQQFNILQSGWLGILAITLLGPILEELLFRGGVMQALLKRYSPGKSIFFSALIFGLFHLNPAQVVGAFLIGLLLGWIYYRTRSLIPCILMHILINSSSVFLTLHYPHVDSLKELMPATPYYILIFLAAALFVVCCGWMKRATQKT